MKNFIGHKLFFISMNCEVKKNHNYDYLEIAGKVIDTGNFHFTPLGELN